MTSLLKSTGPHVITIDGIIGSGKSSLIAQLSEFYTCFQEPLADWSLLHSFYSDMKTYAAPFQFQVLFSYHKLYSTFKNINDIVIIERSPYTSNYIFADMMFEKNMISRSEMDIYSTFFDKLAFPINAFIYLQLDPSVAYQRICQRDRAAEKDLTYDYLVQLNEKYATKMAEIGRTNLVLTIDANQSTNDIKRDVLNMLSSQTEGLRCPPPRAKAAVVSTFSTNG